MADVATPPGAGTKRWRGLEPLVRLVSATVAIGAGAGAIVGGLGGRLAMRILFLTSDESVKGLRSDDGFIIGRFTLADTIGLLVFTTFLGVMAALLYLLARPFLTRIGSPVVPTTALLYGAIGGSLLVHTDGVDFRVLEPAALSIGLFVVISAGFGAVVAHLVGVAAGNAAWLRARSWWVLGPPLLFLLIPPYLLVAAAAALVNRAADEGRDDWRWRVLQIGALAVMAGLFVFGAVKLGRDTATLT